MKKTTTVRATIDPERKRKAGEILARLGLNHSEAINIFYSLIVENDGLPFPVRLPGREPAKKESAGLKPSPEPRGLSPEALSQLKKSTRINLRLGRSLP